MKISKMIYNLQRFMDKHGDLECWYAVDEEGNAYHEVYYAPSLYYTNEYGEVYQLEDIENDEEDVEDYEPICIIN
jgi:hypothetical protein